MKKILFTAIPLLLLLLTSGTCTRVADSTARKRQIENLAANTVKNHFLEQLRQAKIRIQETYREMHRLQDSVRQAAFNTATIQDLGWADLDGVLSLLDATGRPLSAYTHHIVSGSAADNIEAPYSGGAPQAWAAMVYHVANMRDHGGKLPTTLADYRLREQARQQLGLAFEEYGEKRKLQMAQVYLALSGQLHRKAMEMDLLLKTDKVFSMGDAERLHLEKLVLDMVEKNYQLIERADQLSLTATAKAAEFKDRELATLQRQLLGKALAQTAAVKHSRFE